MNDIKKALPLIALAGNVIFALWIMYNAIDDGFRGTIPEKVSSIGLIGLLAINSYMVLTRTRNQD